MAKLLNDGSGYAGFTEWRLPNPHELQSIVDDSRYDPSIDTTAFPGTPSSSRFWSSSSYAYYTNSAWYVIFDFGSVYYYGKPLPSNVRCVRGGPEDSAIGSFDHLIISGEVGEGIVTDIVTGLVWRKSYVTNKTWVQALAYCEDLDYAGENDWRLPNKKELMSLVNYEIYNPASRFPDMSLNWVWSSSSKEYDKYHAWCVHFSYGYVFNCYKTDTYDLLCVRGGP